MEHATCQIDACLERKQGRFVGVGGDGDDDAVEEAGRATHEIVVAICNRVESAWIQCTAMAVHSLLSPLLHWKKSPTALFRTSPRFHRQKARFLPAAHQGSTQVRQAASSRQQMIPD